MGVVGTAKDKKGTGMNRRDMLTGAAAMVATSSDIGAAMAQPTGKWDTAKLDDAAKVMELTSLLQTMAKLPYHPFKPTLSHEPDWDVEEWWFENSRSLQGQRSIG